jgi:hypothetical protein
MTQSYAYISMRQGESVESDVMAIVPSVGGCGIASREDGTRNSGEPAAVVVSRSL